MKKMMVFALVSVFVLGASFAHATCTADDAQKKALQVATQLQTLAQKDPARFQQLTQEYQQKAGEMQKKMTDMDAVCKYFDEMIEKTK